MTSHGIKKKKVKQQRKFVGARNDNTTGCGFTNAQSRGIFGTGHKLKGRELDRVKEYEEKRQKYLDKHPRKEIKDKYYEFEQRYPGEKSKINKCPDRNTRDDLGRLGVQLVGFKRDDGTIIRFD